MNDGIDIFSGKQVINNDSETVNAGFEYTLKPRTDDIESEEEDETHNADESGDSGILTCENAVDASAAEVFAAFGWFSDSLRDDIMDKGEAHISDSGAAVETAFFFELSDDMLHSFDLILVEGKLFDDEHIVLNDLTCGESQGNTGIFGMVLNEVFDTVDTSVDSAAVSGFSAEVVDKGFFLIMSDMDSVFKELIDAFIFSSGDRDDRNAEEVFEGINIDTAAIGGKLVHHIECDYHRNIHFEELHGEVEVTFDIGNIDDIDDSVRFFVQDEISSDDLLAGIRGHGVDTRQVSDEGIGVTLDSAVLAVNSNAGEVANVLFRAGKTVKEGSFTAVLVTHEGEAHGSTLREGRAVVLGVEPAALTETGVFGFFIFLSSGVFLFGLADRSDADIFGIGEAQGEFVVMEAQLHGIAHGSELNEGDLGTGDKAHIEEMLAKRAISADFFYFYGLTDLNCIKSIHDNIGSNRTLFSIL